MVMSSGVLTGDKMVVSHIKRSRLFGRSRKDLSTDALPGQGHTCVGTNGATPPVDPTNLPNLFPQLSRTCSQQALRIAPMQVGHSSLFIR